MTRWRAARRCGAWLLLCSTALAGEPVPLVEVADGVYVHVGPHGEASPGNLGAVGNAGVIVGQGAVAIVDTGGSLAFGRRLLASVRALTALPVRYVINTHVHPDHVLGNAAFDNGTVEFVGHYKLERALASRAPFYLAAFERLVGADFAGTGVVAPQVLVRDELQLDLGDRPIVLTAYETAHTDNDLTVMDLRTRTLFAGDLLFMERLPVIDGSLKGWLRATAALRRVQASRAVPGHGPASVRWPVALDSQDRYLGAVLDGVREEIAAGGTIETALRRVAREERDRWLLFDDNHPRNVTASFAELEWE
jgi:quinoprotein relay system zinc metallohydrolase 2